MAFKTAKAYNEEHFSDFFILRNDGDWADVIFLYESEDDVLVADTHYIKSDDYSGYVHCLGRGCPACSKRLRTQTKLFIPMYNISTNSIQFFDRTVRFEPQLHTDVFSKCPNPSEFVWRIIRRGAPGDVNTKYEITPIGRNDQYPYAKILKEFGGISFPDYYSKVCREFSSIELSNALSGSKGSGEVGGYSTASMPSYTITPRGVSNAPAAPTYSPSTSVRDVVPAVSITSSTDSPKNNLEIPEDFSSNLDDEIDGDVDFG